VASKGSSRKRGAPCKVWVTQPGRLTATATAVSGTVSFSGRIGKKALQPGRYRAALTATGNGGSSEPKVITFRIVKPRTTGSRRGR
jgi:hypothetical protein